MSTHPLGPSCFANEVKSDKIHVAVNIHVTASYATAMGTAADTLNFLPTTPE